MAVRPAGKEIDAKRDTDHTHLHLFDDLVFLARVYVITAMRILLVFSGFFGQQTTFFLMHLIGSRKGCSCIQGSAVFRGISWPVILAPENDSY